MVLNELDLPMGSPLCAKAQDLRRRLFDAWDLVAVAAHALDCGNPLSGEGVTNAPALAVEPPRCDPVKSPPHLEEAGPAISRFDDWWVATALDFLSQIELVATAFSNASIAAVTQQMSA